LGERLDTLPVFAGETCIGGLRWEFEPVPPATAEISAPTALLAAMAAPHEEFLSMEWPIGASDRNDRFSARWTANLRIEPATLRVRLRADDRAVFYLNGRERLVCDAERPVATATLELDARLHDLRVDYTERTGPAHVFLEEWRTEAGAWVPWVPRVLSQPVGPTDPGWLGTYFLGEDFEEEAFRERVSSIGFDWGGGGPFSRPGDRPAFRIDWANSPTGGFYGRCRCNRTGSLRLSWLVPASSREDPLSATQESAEFHFRNSSTGSTVDLRFNQPPAKTEFLEKTASSFGEALCRMRFTLAAGADLVFWEDSSELPHGGTAAEMLDSAEKRHHQTRLRLTGDLEPWDNPAALEGRFWVFQFLERMQYGDPFGATEASFPAFESSHLIASLPESVSDYLSLFAPDLRPTIPDLLGQPLPTHFARLVPPTPGRERDLLGASPSDLSRERDWWSGLWQAIESVHRVGQVFGRMPDGGVDLGGEGYERQSVGIENWSHRGKRFTWRLSGTQTRLEQVPQGRVLTFSQPARLRGFEIGEEGTWRFKVNLEDNGYFETHPALALRRATWDKQPLLLLRQGDFYRSGRLSDKEGMLTLYWSEKTAEIPR
jgi:hypothetical protein